MESQKTTRSASPEETEMLAEAFLNDIVSGARKAGATVVGLYGELGAGKTAFVRGVARALGVTGTVTSPTFVLEKIYQLERQPFDHLVHIDAYRLKGSEEFAQLGIDDLLRGNNLIVIEWADRVEIALPEGTLRVYFSHTSKTERDIRFA